MLEETLNISNLNTRLHLESTLSRSALKCLGKLLTGQTNRTVIWGKIHNKKTYFAPTQIGRGKEKSRNCHNIFSQSLEKNTSFAAKLNPGERDRESPGSRWGVQSHSCCMKAEREMNRFTVSVLNFTCGLYVYPTSKIAFKRGKNFARLKSHTGWSVCLSPYLPNIEWPEI